MKNPVIPLLFFTLARASSVHAQCTHVAGPNGGALTSVTGGGINWINPSNITANDGAVAHSSLVVFILGSGTSKTLVLQNLGFSIPAAATICGITVEIKHYASGLLPLATVADHSVQVIKGVTYSSDLSSHSDWGGAPVFDSYGGTSNTWGLSWTPADINASTFGVAVSVDFSSFVSVTLNANIDYIQVTVNYDMTVLASSPLQGFAAAKKDKGNLLSWSYTDAGTSIKSSGSSGSPGSPGHCTIQRSSDSRNWQDLTAMELDKKNSSYSWMDASPLPGRNFYRLHAQAQDGSGQYSEIVSVMRESAVDANRISLYPNPVHQTLHISGRQLIRQVRLRDLQGRLLLSTAGSSADLSLPLSNLPPGLYLVEVDGTVYKLAKK